MIMYKGPRQMPYPPRYRSIFTCALQFDIKAATIASDHWYFPLNSCVLPFNKQAGGGSGIGSASYENISPAFATLQPAGFSLLCNSIANNGLYTNYRVLASKITISSIPQAVSDTLLFTITPVNSIQGTGNPATTGPAIELPMTKSNMEGQGQANTKISYYTKPYIVEGYKRQAIELDVSGAYVATSAAYPTALNYWIVNWSTVDAANLANKTPVIIKLKYYVELTEPNYSQLKET